MPPHAIPSPRNPRAMNSRERFFALLQGKLVDRPPVMPITMQFACAHLGAVYRDYCTDFRTMVEGQIRTAEDFGFDYVNTMSDPAREAADCGAEVRYFDHQPVAIVEENALLSDKNRLTKLKIPDPLGGGRMHNGIQALALYKERVGSEKIIEGWVEGPIAQAADLRGINHLMTDFFDDPKFVHDVFAFVTDMELRFAAEQVKAGADCIGVGDAAASLVGPAVYDEFVLPYQKRLVEGLHGLGTKVRLHICGNIRKLLERIATLGCDIIDLDYPVPMIEARAALGPHVVLIGNLNPVTAVRDSTPDSICNGLAGCNAAAGSRFIVGAGCELPRDTPAINVEAFRKYADSVVARSWAGHV